MTLARDGWVIFIVALILITITLSPLIQHEVVDDEKEFIIIDIDDSEFFDDIIEDDNHAPIILNITRSIE